jgi:N-acetylneuraminate synthase
MKIWLKNNMSPRFISEISSNHNASLERALLFVDESARIGCHAVKFQLFKISELFAPEILQKSEQHRSRAKWELPLDFLAPLSERTREHNMEFSCTPFYLKAVEELFPFVDFYKIASYELLWDDLLIDCAQTGKPVIISTGMANLDEIDHAVEVLKENGCQNLTLLHCVSNYPTLPEECNLKFMETLKNRYQINIGWSDHSVNPKVVQRAISQFGASDIEFHLDLDEKGFEFGGKHCWLPHQIKPLVKGVPSTEFVDADGMAIKVLCEAEENERIWRADPVDGLRPLKIQRALF